MMYPYMTLADETEIVHSQIIEKDGFAFKDLNATGNLDKFEDWRLPLTLRIHDFKTQFGLWQEKDCLYYPKGKIQIPVDVYDNLLFLYEHKLFHIENRAAAYNPVFPGDEYGNP